MRGAQCAPGGEGGSADGLSCSVLEMRQSGGPCCQGRPRSRLFVHPTALCPIPTSTLCLPRRFDQSRVLESSRFVQVQTASCRAHACQSMRCLGPPPAAAGPGSLHQAASLPSLTISLHKMLRSSTNACRRCVAPAFGKRGPTRRHQFAPRSSPCRPQLPKECLSLSIDRPLIYH